MYSLISSLSRPVSPSSQSPSNEEIRPRGTKRPFMTDVVEITMDELFRFCLRLRNDLDSQLEHSRNLEQQIRELKGHVDSLPPPSSLPHPPPEITIEDDDDMGNGTDIVTAPKTTVIKDPATSPTVPSPIENTSDLERSIVIARLPLDPSLTPVEQVHRDYDQVIALSDLIGFPVLPISVYRMPVASPDAPHNRLTKVLLPTRKHAQLMVKFSHRVKKDAHFSQVFIRPSFANPEERPKTPAIRRNTRNRTPSQSRDRNTAPRNPWPQNPPPPPRTRSDSVFSQDKFPPQDARRVRKNSNRPQRYPPPSFPQFPPRPLFDTTPPFGFPPQQSMPFPAQFTYPNPYLSFVSQYGVPPNMGQQGNW